MGGAVVSIYSDGAYKSGDLDFICTRMFQKNLPEAMEEIGFRNDKSRHYIHPACSHLFIEFPSNFLQIGEENNVKPDEIEYEGVKIKILSPTDCVKDRLASYIHFQARECLDQAVLVAKKHPIKIENIKNWCLAEGGKIQFEDFLKKFREK